MHSVHCAHDQKKASIRCDSTIKKVQIARTDRRNILLSLYRAPPTSARSPLGVERSAPRTQLRRRSLGDGRRAQQRYPHPRGWQHTRPKDHEPHRASHCCSTDLRTPLSAEVVAQTRQDRRDLLRSSRLKSQPHRLPCCLASEHLSRRRSSIATVLLVRGAVPLQHPSSGIDGVQAAASS